MIVALPVAENRFSPHFGGADAFALYTVDPDHKRITSRRIIEPPVHGRGVFPGWLKSQGATVVLAGGMGPRAVSMFEQQNIELHLGVEANDPDEAVKRYLEGSLVATGAVCQDQGFHDCGHHHGRKGTTS